MCLPYSLDGGSCSSSKLRYIILNVKFQFQAKHTICQVGKMHLIIIHYLLGGIPTPLKNISQLVWLFPVHGKIQAMFQTTNQLYVTPILSQVYTPWIVASTPNRMAQIPPGLWCTSASAPPGHCNKPIDSGLSTSRHHLRPLQSQLSLTEMWIQFVAGDIPSYNKNTIHIWLWLNIVYLIFQRIFIIYQWPVQEPKLEVPTIYKAYISGLCKRISPQNMAKHMVLTYLHFRILKISHWIYCIEVTIFVGIQTVFRAPHWHYCGTNRVVITHWDSCA